MEVPDVKLAAAVLGNISLNGVWLFIQKATPVLTFILVVFQLIAAAATVWHIFIRKAPKNEKVTLPPDPGL